MATAKAIPMTSECRVSRLMARLIDQPAEPHAELMTLSVEDCRSILEHRNPKNRHLGKKRRLDLAAVMKSGQWRVNGETVIFGSHGNLLDGQGRLAAAVTAETPLETWVVFGVDPDAFDVIDRGKKRSTADDLSIEGEECVTTLAATLNLIHLDAMGDLRSAGRNPTVSSPLARAYLEEHPEVRESVKVAKGCYKVLAPSVGAFCHLRFSTLNRTAADRFFADLRTGAGLPLLDPVLALRNRLLNGKAQNERVPEREAIALVTKAWNARRQGRELKFLQFRENDERMPEPI